MHTPVSCQFVACVFNYGIESLGAVCVCASVHVCAVCTGVHMFAPVCVCMCTSSRSVSKLMRNIFQGTHSVSVFVRAFTVECVCVCFRCRVV